MSSLDRRRPQTVHLAGSAKDMDIVLEELRASTAAHLYAEPLRAITVAVMGARAQRHAAVRVSLAEIHAAPFREFLLWKAERLRLAGDTVRADALRRVADSNESGP